MHLALIALGIGENDVVLCPSLTFSASCNIIIYQNAIPVFLDVDTKSWTLDIDTLNVAVKKYKPKALIAVDLYGQICNYDEIYNICKKNGVFIVEDSAESLGSMYKNEKAGSFGDISIFSFNGNKIITTSGGGMLLTDNKEFFDKAKLIANQAKENRHYYHHKHLGYNYRLSNLLAAIGIGQMKVLQDRVKARRAINEIYREKLNSYDFDFLTEGHQVHSNYWLTTIKFKNDRYKPDEIIEGMNKAGIECRLVWKPMHMQPYYKAYEYLKSSDGDNSKLIFQRGLCLPSGSSLSDNDMYRVISKFNNIIGDK